MMSANYCQANAQIRAGVCLEWLKRPWGAFAGSEKTEDGVVLVTARQHVEL